MWMRTSYLQRNENAVSIHTVYAIGLEQFCKWKWFLRVAHTLISYWLYHPATVSWMEDTESNSVTWCNDSWFKWIAALQISKQEYAVTVTGTRTISKELNFIQISEHLNHSVFWSECSIKLTDIVVSTPPLERSRCSLHLLPWIRNSWFGSPRCNHGSKESEIHR